MAPTCNPGSTNCTVHTFINSLGGPNQVLMVNPGGNSLEYRSPDTSMVAENGNLYYTNERVWNYLSNHLNNSNGLLQLDGSGKVPLSLIPDSLLGNVRYRGSGMQLPIHLS